MSQEPLTRLLLVEDDTDIQKIAKLSLEMNGYSLKVCGSGVDALRDVPAFQPQLILMDVMMPGMDGPSTFKALKAIPQAASIPIIFMTAKVQKEEVEKYRELGAVGVIQKPFDPMNLSALIMEIWRKI